MADKRKYSKRPRDLNVHAFSTVAIASGESTSPDAEQVESTPKERHNAAITLGRKGGKARATKLTPEQRKEIARKAAQARGLLGTYRFRRLRLRWLREHYRQLRYHKLLNS